MISREVYDEKVSDLPLGLQGDFWPIKSKNHHVNVYEPLQLVTENHTFSKKILLYIVLYFYVFEDSSVFSCNQRTVELNPF